jgi:hypothetical protein
MTSKSTSSPLPDFDEQGNLPDGVHPCDESRFEARFVILTPKHTERKRICEGFFRLREEAADFQIVGTQWVDGSFVTNKPDPNDVDVVTFVDYDEANSLNADQQTFVLECIDGEEKTKSMYRCHTFYQACCPPGHPYL